MPFYRTKTYFINFSTPQQSNEPQAFPYLTREDVAAILLEARKAESFAYIDTRSTGILAFHLVY